MHHQIFVLNPIARTTHQPARPSKMQNAPLRMQALEMIHASGLFVISAQVNISTTPRITKIIPVRSRTAFPAASMLHCMM